MLCVERLLLSCCSSEPNPGAMRMRVAPSRLAINMMASRRANPKAKGRSTRAPAYSAAVEEQVRGPARSGAYGFAAAVSACTYGDQLPPAASQHLCRPQDRKRSQHSLKAG